MKELRSLALQSLPDSPGIRSTVWKVGSTVIVILVCLQFGNQFTEDRIYFLVMQQCIELRL